MLIFWATHKHDNLVMKRRWLIKRKRKLKPNGIDFKLQCNASKRFGILYWKILIPKNCYTSLAYLCGRWSLSQVTLSHELRRMMILLKQFEWQRLVMKSLLSLHEMLIIGILNPLRPREKRRCKMYVSTMNRKRFVVSKFTSTYFFLTLFFHCAFKSWHYFFLVLKLWDTTKEAFMVDASNLHFTNNNFSIVTMQQRP